MSIGMSEDKREKEEGVGGWGLRGRGGRGKKEGRGFKRERKRKEGRQDVVGRRPPSSATACLLISFSCAAAAADKEYRDLREERELKGRGIPPFLLPGKERRGGEVGRGEVSSSSTRTLLCCSKHGRAGMETVFRERERERGREAA